MGGKQASAVEEHAERILFSTRIDKDLVKKMRIISAEEDRDIYVLVEEALRQFTKNKGK